MKKILNFTLIITMVIVIGCSGTTDPEKGSNAPSNLVATYSFNAVNLLLIVDLVWDAPEEPDNDNFEYRVYKDDQFIFALSNMQNYYTDMDCELGGEYTYYITAYYPTGESEPSNIVQMTFDQPSNLNISQLSVTSCKLTWTDNSNNEQGFRIDRKIDSETWQVGYAEVGANVTELTEQDLEATSTYNYRVYGFVGEISTTTMIEGYIYMSFPAPVNFQIIQATITSCDLTWGDISVGEEGFRIDRKIDSETWQVGYAEVGANVTELTEQDLEATSTYNYRVYGFAGDNTSTSLEESIDITFPTPVNLTYTFENISYPTADIHLDWDYSMSGIDGFKIKWNGTLLSEVIPAGITEWIDAGVDIENSNSYQVMALFQTNNSGFSNELFIDEINCIDIDGNIYQTIQIGNQEWMAENLKVTQYRNGDAIPHLTDSGSWVMTSSGAYCVYNNTPANAETYGNLYNWYAVDDSRNIAPEGWHVPTDDEIKELEMYLGMNASQANSTGSRGTNEGSKLAGRADLWSDGALENDPEFGTSGFSFLPGGSRYGIYGSYSGYVGINGYLWSSSGSSIYSAWYRTLYYTYTTVHRSRYEDLRSGFSVRCVRD